MKKLLILLLAFTLVGCELDKDKDNNGVFDDKEPTGSSNPSDPSSTTDLKVGSFNIQIFGVSKMSKSEVVNILVKTVSRYDLVLIQEIRDETGSTMINFMEFLNDANDNQYEFIISSRTGRSTSKEQYAYVYKKTLLEVVDSFDFNDTSDVFEREPFIALFKFLPTGDEFFTIGMHAKPDSTQTLVELNYLDDVYSSVEDLYNNNKSIIMGDFNADCSYLSDAQYNSVTIFNDSAFTSHINKTQDTTVSNSDCAYDKLVTTGSLSNRSKNVEIFNFQNAFNLNQAAALDVSDHFPVGLTLSF